MAAIAPSPDRPHAGPAAPSHHVTAAPIDSADLRWSTVGAAVACTVVLTVVAVRAADRLVDVAGLTLAAVCLALLTSPLELGLARRIGAAAAITLTALSTLLVTTAVGLAVLADLRTQVRAFGDAVRERLADLSPGSLPDRLATSLRIDEAIADWTGDVATTVVTGQTTGAAAGRQMMSLFFVVILAAFLQAGRRGFVDHVAGLWPRATTEVEQGDGAGRRAEVRAFLADVESRGAGSARRTVALAAVAAVTVAAAAALLHVPGALVIGIWAGAWAVVHSVGWFVAALPVGLLATINHEPGTIASVAVVLVVSVACASVRTRWIEPSRVRLGAGVHVSAVAVGVAVGGLAGTLVAVVVASLAVAALTSDRWPGLPPRPAGRVVALPTARGVRGVAVPSAASLVGIVLAIAAGVAFGLAVLERLVPAIAWLAIGSFVAIALRRPADRLQRFGLRPYVARSVVLAMVGAVIVASVIAGADDGARASSRVADRLPEIVDDLEGAPLVGGWLAERDASTWMSAQIEDLPQRFRSARTSSWLPGVTARLVDLWWTMVIAAALLFDGDRIVRGGLRRVPARRRRQADRLVHATGVALTGYAAGAALLATINASVVFTIAVVLGIGLAPVVAVWAFVWNFVPQIGGFMGGVPLILFALVSGPAHALVAGGLFLTYQLLENHLIQPAIIGAAIDVPPWGTLLAALAGSAAAGVLGAILLTPLVGVVRVIRQELRSADFPGTR